MISRKRAGEITEKFKSRKVLVVGDLMVDRYVAGTVNRISPEAPVPVVHVTEEKILPGGAANVALNIRSLGGKASVAGILGKDDTALELEKILKARGITTDGVVKGEGIRTTVKTRVLAGRQQVVRFDREDSVEDLKSVIKKFARKLKETGNTLSGVIIEDYGKGAITQEVVDAVIGMSRKLEIPVGLDPKENYSLDVKGITVATPNYLEARSAAGTGGMWPADEPKSRKELNMIADILLEKWGVELLVITLGSRGMLLAPKKGKREEIPTKARDVFDVSGAGDTVIAAMMLGLVSGADYREAVSLANYAAGVVVGKVGTATCGPDELLKAIV